MRVNGILSVCYSSLSSLLFCLKLLFQDTDILLTVLVVLIRVTAQVVVSVEERLFDSCLFVEGSIGFLSWIQKIKKICYLLAIGCKISLMLCPFSLGISELERRLLILLAFEYIDS